MKMIVLVLSLIALAAPAQAAQNTQSRHDSQSLEQKCRQMVGKEQYEGEGEATSARCSRSASATA